MLHGPGWGGKEIAGVQKQTHRTTPEGAPRIQGQRHGGHSSPASTSRRQVTWSRRLASHRAWPRAKGIAEDVKKEREVKNEDRWGLAERRASFRRGF